MRKRCKKQATVVQACKLTTNFYWTHIRRRSKVFSKTSRSRTLVWEESVQNSNAVALHVAASIFSTSSPGLLITPEYHVWNVGYDDDLTLW